MDQNGRENCLCYSQVVFFCYCFSFGRADRTCRNYTDDEDASAEHETHGAKFLSVWHSACWAPHFYSTLTHLVPALQFAKLTSAGETGPTGLRIILFPLAVIHSGVGVWIKSDQEVCRKLPEKFCSALNKKQQEVSLSFPCQMRMW